MKPVYSAFIMKEPKLKDDKEEVSSMSKDSTYKEPGICFYPCITSKQGKMYKKSRRCIDCQKLTVIYCNCCSKAYCYIVGRKKHNHICLEDYIKIMKKRN